MIDMARGKNHCGDWSVAQMLARKRNRRRRRFTRSQGVDQNPTGLAVDQRDVGNIKAAQLMNTFGDFEQTHLIVQNRVPPQARIHARWRLTLDKSKTIVIPYG